jgi:tetratricopeptide (TPR) repeat protein
MLEGSVQRSGDRIRVNVQLIDAQDGNHLWADRFDKPVADLFDMQDEIVARVVNELRAVIVSTEARRAEQAASPDSADLTFRGFDRLQKGISPESLDKAHESFSRALEIDPDNVQALLGQVLADTISAQLYAFDDRGQRIESAGKLALRALSSAPRDPMAHYCMGLLLVLSNRAEEGINELTLALGLEPNNAFAHAQIGLAKIALGRAEEAEAHIAEAIRLSPRDLGLYIWYTFIGMAKMHLAADEEAVSWLRKSVQANRSYFLSRFLLSAALARCGRMDSARAETQAGLGLAPDFTVGRYAGLALADNPTYLARNERILEGLRLAGVPE